MSDAAVLACPTRSDAASVTDATSGRPHRANPYETLHDEPRTDAATNALAAEHRTVAVAAAQADLHAVCKQCSVNTVSIVPMEADWSLRAWSLLRAWAQLGDMHPLGKQQQAQFRRACGALLGGHFLALAHAFALWRVWTMLWLSSSAHDREPADSKGAVAARAARNATPPPAAAATARAGAAAARAAHNAATPPGAAAAARAAGAGAGTAPATSPWKRMHAPPLPELSWSASPLSTPSRPLPRHQYQAASSPALSKMLTRSTPQSCSGPLPPPPGGRFGSPRTPSTAASLHAERSSFLSQATCSLATGTESFANDEIAKLHSDASLLRLECGALAERHWLLCSEVCLAADEMREHLRVAARASSDERLSLHQACRIGRWFLNVSDRLKNLTTFMHQEDFRSLVSRGSAPYLSLARICSPV